VSELEVPVLFVIPVSVELLVPELDVEVEPVSVVLLAPRSELDVSVLLVESESLPVSVELLEPKSELEVSASLVKSLLEVSPVSVELLSVSPVSVELLSVSPVKVELVPLLLLESQVQLSVIVEFKLDEQVSQESVDTVELVSVVPSVVFAELVSGRLVLGTSGLFATTPVHEQVLISAVDP